MVLNAPSMAPYVVTLIVAVDVLACVGLFGAIVGYAFWVMTLAFVIPAGAY